MKRIIFAFFMVLMFYSHGWAITRILNANKTSVNFGSIGYNSGVKYDTIILTNSGDNTISVTNTYFVKYPNIFAVIQNSAPPTQSVLPIGPSGPLLLRIRATAYEIIGTFNDTLVIVNNSDNKPVMKIPVTFTVTPIYIKYSWSKDSINFGNVIINTAIKYDTVFLNTTDYHGIDVLETKFLKSPSVFNIILNKVPPVCSLFYYQPLGIGISVNPNTLGTFEDTLQITTSSIPTYLKIPVKITVTPPPVIINTDKTELDFGTNGYYGNYKDQVLTITNTSQTTDVVFSAAAFENETPYYSVMDNFPFTIPKNSSKGVTVRFYPNITGTVFNLLHLINNSTNQPNLTISLVGNVIGSNITVTPGSIDFGSIGYQSVPKDTTFIITNSGQYKLALNSIYEFVPDTIFQITSGLPAGAPTILDPGQTYNLKVRLNPVQMGLKKDSIRIDNNSTNAATKTVSLSANILRPNLTFTPSELDFGETKLDTPARIRSLLINNNGSTSITITKNEILNDTVSFKFIRNLNNIILQPGKTDSLLIEFRPRLAGARSGFVKITSTDPLGSQRQMNMKGTGGGKAILFTDKRIIDCGEVIAGSPKDTLITIRNDGNLNLSVTSKSFTGADNAMFSFVFGGNPNELRQGETEPIRIRIIGALPFGAKTAQLRFISNDPDKPTYDVGLTAFVKAPAITRVPDRITFDTTAVGSFKDTIIVVNNSGNAPLSINKIYFDGGFASDFETDNYSLPVIVQPGASFNIKIRFKPLGAGLRFARAAIQSNDLANPEVFTILIGNGKVVDQPSIYLAFRSLSFGKILINTRKDTTFTLSNTGTKKLVIDSLNLTGSDKAYFTLAGPLLPIQLDTGKSQSLTLSFLPTLNDTLKIYQSDFRIKSNDPMNPLLVVPLSGSGKLKNEGGAITFNPAKIDFGTVALYGFKDTVITITNTLSTNRTIDSLNIIGNDKAYFSLQTAFPLTLLSNSSQQIIVRFSPGSTDIQKIYSATLRIKTSDVSSPLLTVDLSGKAKQAASSLFVSAYKIDFGKTTLNYKKVSSFSIKNIGVNSLLINSIILQGNDAGSFKFSDVITFPFSLNPFEERIVKLDFSPSTVGTKQASVKISSSDITTPTAIIDLTGEGVSPKIETVSSVNFGNLKINLVKDTFIVVKNSGEGVLNIINTEITGSDAASFAIIYIKTIPEINSLQTDTIFCRFLPVSSGSKSAVMAVTSNDITNPVLNIGLSGTGTKPQISVAPAAISFGKILTGSVKDTTFRISNTGSYPLNISGLMVTGNDSLLYSLSGYSLPFVLNVSESKTISIRFKSSGSGIKNANVMITSDDPDAAFKNISLSAEALAVAKILNQTPDSVAVQTVDKTVTFSLSNPITPNSVKIFYRLGGGTVYDSSTIPVSGTTFNYVFNKNLFTHRGLDYFIKMVIDGSEITLPETDYYNHPLILRVKIAKVYSAEQLKSGQYSMLAIPFVFNATNFPGEIFRNFGKSDPFIWRVLSWTGSNYSELSETNLFNIITGKGFWVIYHQDYPFNFNDVITTPTNEPCKITLLPGWNQIGLPFLFPVRYSDIIFPAGKNVETKLWRWNATKYIEENLTLNPFTGYFIMNNEAYPVDLYIKPIYSPALAAYKSSNTAQSDEWKIKLSLAGSNGQSDEVEIGGAAAQLSINNFSKPPAAPGNNIDIRIVEGLKEYAGLFKTLDGNGASWDIDLNNLSVNSRYVLSYELQGSLPENTKIVFIDCQSGNKLFSEGSQLSIHPDASSKRLRIIVGEKSYIDDELTKTDISEYRLLQNYPNPFNPSTKIEYTLQENCSVTLKIYNQLGQEIAVLVNSPQNKGRHFAVWEAGKTPSGIYYYKLSAGAYSAIKKMLLLK